jgi:hypothetical protein
MNDLVASVSPATLVAWRVDDEETGEATIVFAAEESIAAVEGACLLCSDLEAIKVERSPEYDQYAALEYVPAEVLYSDGMWFECPHCLCQVSQNNENEDEYGQPVEPKFSGEVVFCSQECQADFKAETERIQARRDKAKKDLLELFPGISITRCWGGDELHPVIVEFHFPGGAKTVRWNGKEPNEVDVINVDVPAWHTFSGAIREPKSLPCAYPSVPSIVEVRSEPVL